MTDEDLLALNVYQEAGGEIEEGKAAVARITLNRMRRKFRSDGTMPGTVLAKDQFSWAYFGFVEGKYIRLCHTRDEAAARAESLLLKVGHAPFATCRQVALAVQIEAYNGPAYDLLTDDALSYLNPRILTKLPDWAIPEKLVCSIGHHDFYRK